MMPISFDFSERTDLRWLGKLAAAFRDAAGAIPFLVVGATARDLLLQHTSGISLLRATDDVDIAVVAGEWRDFDDLKRRLVATGSFTAVPGTTHRVLFRHSHKVDLVPFGGVEGPDRSITWPPDGDTIMNVFGFQEVLAGAIEITLPDGVRVLVPSLAGLALTKLIAWVDRRDRVRGKDAYDLDAILGSYPPPGNEERLIAEAEAAHLFDEGGFDYEWAGAWLLGHDMAALLSPDQRPQIATLLNAEADPTGQLRLVGDMSLLEPERGLVLIHALARGFQSPLTRETETSS